jgi:hypothetical protein
MITHVTTAQSLDIGDVDGHTASLAGTIEGVRTRFVGKLAVVGGKGRFEGATGDGTLTGTRYTSLSVGADLVSDYTVNLRK